jgi:glutathione synthase/RimK-type ligase-like ATP-grasp enzyme
LDLCEKLISFHKAIGTLYSSFDLVLNHNDEYVFLETNPFGQWLWIEDLTGLPISKTIADYLLGEVVA